MTREEEIKQATNESLCDENRIAKYLYEKKGYPIDMNGNLPSFDDIMKDVEKYLKYKQDKFIEKAIILLNNNFMAHDEHGVISHSFETEEEMLDVFKNYIKGE